jgi:hypothetical protein
VDSCFGLNTSECRFDLAASAAVQEGCTALHWSAREGHEDCMRLLLDAGADKNVTDEVRTVGASASSGAGSLHSCTDVVEMRKCWWTHELDIVTHFHRAT